MYKQKNHADRLRLLRDHHHHTMLFDDHNPPHFHVTYGEYRALITIRDGVIQGTLPRRALNMIYEWLDLHRDELMENWSRIEKHKALKPVEPLT